LDGWEEADIPAFEHLTHSPSCGFAVVTCIRLRTGDPGRAEEDPMSDAMMQARRDTFGESWPLDSSEGFPSIEQVRSVCSRIGCITDTTYSWLKLAGTTIQLWTHLTVPPAHTARSPLTHGMLAMTQWKNTDDAPPIVSSLHSRRCTTL
jgi:hypothetical protein